MSIYKRGDTWYERFSFQGKVHRKSLDTGIEAEARRRHALRQKAREEERYAELERVLATPTTPTLGEVVDWYLAQPPEFLRHKTPRTARSNVSALKMIMKALGQEDNWRIVRVSELTAAMVERYARLTMAAAGDDPEDRRRAAGRITSYLIQARSLFKAPLLASMERDGLRCGDLTGFKSAHPIERPAPVSRLISKDELAAWRARFESIRLEQPELHIAYLLCYGLALRVSEALAIRWEWLDYDPVREMGQAAIIKRPYFTPKGRDRCVPFGPVFWRSIQTYNLGDPMGHIIPGTLSDRHNLLYRGLGRFMRPFGWQGHKTAHALRAWRGQEWWTLFSPAECQAWLGHADLTTTYRHYAGLMDGLRDRRVDIL